MGLEISLRSHLINEVNGIEGRAYPVNLPKQPELPALTYQIVSGSRQYTHSGDTEKKKKRVQIDIWSRSYGETKEIAEEVIEALSGFYGAMQDTDIGKSHMENEQDAYSPETGMYHVPLDFLIGYYDK